MAAALRSARLGSVECGLPSQSQQWAEVGRHPLPSWYLDRVVAEQKGRLHQALIRRWTPDLHGGRVLKTDLFEEACGADQILFDLFGEAGLVMGIDLAWPIAHRARARRPDRAIQFLISDVRSLAVRSESMDLIVSTSTLDHFASRAEFCAALWELKRVLRAGGVAIVTPLLHRPGQMHGAAVEQQLFGQRRLTGVRVGDDREGSPACHFRFQSFFRVVHTYISASWSARDLPAHPWAPRLRMSPKGGLHSQC